jgi:hypothetical protein
MSENWFYRVFGEEFGPISLNDLREMAQNGTLSGDDEVRPEALSMWVPAKAVRELQEHYQNEVETSSTVTSMMNDATSAPAPTDEWYYRMTDDDGVEVGPLTFDALIELAKSGRLTADDEVRLGVDSKWRRAGSIGRLVVVLPYQTRRQRNASPRPETQVDSLKEMISTLPEVVSEKSPSDGLEESLPEVVSEEPVVERKTPRPTGASRTNHAAAESNDRATPRPKSRRADKQPDRAVEVTSNPSKTAESDDAVPAGLAQEIEDRIMEELMKPSISASAVSAPVSMPESQPASRSSSAMTAPASNSWNSSSAPSSSSFSAPTPMPATKKLATPYKPARTGPSLAEQFKSPAVMKGMATLVVVGLGFWWMTSTPGKGADIARYRELDGLMAELKELREKDKEGKKLIPFKEKLDSTSKRILKEIEPTAGADFPARQRILWATKNFIPQMLSSLAMESDAEKQAIANLDQAAIALGLKDPPKVEIVASASARDD